MLTEEVKSHLSAIRIREQLATRGPWKLWNGYKLVHPYAMSDSAVARIGPENAGIFSGLTGAEDRDIVGRSADLEFVACARDDISFLLDLVEKEEKDAH